MSDQPKASAIVAILYLLAIVIFIASIVAGFVFGKEEHSYTSSLYGAVSSYEKFSIQLALYYWIAGVCIGFVFIWMAEVLKKLHEISFKLSFK